MNLIIITPFYNEENSIIKTITSITKQNLHPIVWLMIDDNSDDSSPEIVKRYAIENSYIKYLKFESKDKKRATGSNIVRLFNFGISFCKENNIGWDIVLKLDADIVVDRIDYLKFIIDKFDQYPNLGIASGVTYIKSPEDLNKIESKHKWHTQGPNKFYRKTCLEDIGGLKPFKGWDGIDDILARNHGYLTEKFFEQPVLHLYPTQTRKSEGGVKSGLMREAAGYNNMGYPAYMVFFKALKLAKSKGFNEGSLFLYYGMKALMFDDSPISKDERKIVRKFMRKRLLNNIRYTNNKSPSV